MYVLLSGAKCNLGDFWIVERAVALLRALRPDRALEVVPGWEPLDEKSEALQSARAVLIPGGPGYQPGFHPEVYPLVPDLQRLPCPVVPIGVGWKGRGGRDRDVAAVRFSDASLAALRWMDERTEALGCRDPLTEQLLHRHGFANVEMVGCPVWYDLAHLGESVDGEAPIERIVFTPPESPLLADQAVAVAERVARLWPDAERIAAFHRGLATTGPWIGEADIAHHTGLSQRLASLGYRSIDVTGSPEKARFYADCSLHVGYRLHAHLDFASRRQRTLLLEEDGRGAGASLGLALEGIPAFLPRTWWRRVHRADPGVPDRIEARLHRERDTGFAAYTTLGPTLDVHFETMRRFLLRLP
ncbi:MAG: polysaccharide pyruvyl transferase family protein [Myxococcota bacterium]